MAVAERKSAKMSDELRGQIIAAIDRSGISKGEIARITGVNRTGLSHFSSGTADLSVPVIEKVLSVMGARLVVQSDETARAAVLLSGLPADRYELALRAIRALEEIAPDDDFEARYGVETLERSALKRQRRAVAA